MARAVLAVVALAACQGSAPPTAPNATPRIVTLSPSATEIVAALGAASYLVGVDDYSEYPAAVKQLPHVGSFIAPNLETIVRLTPTLVIVDDVHSQQAAALHDHGIVTLECAMHALPDVKAALHSVGERIGKQAEATAAVAAIDKALDDAAARRPAKHPGVLVVIDREAGGLGSIVADGPGSWVDELLAVVGGNNVLAAAGTRYPKISTEEVLRAHPDVILDLSYAARTGLAEWSEVAVPAVASKHVVALSQAYLLAPSPRVAAALDTLATSIR